MTPSPSRPKVECRCLLRILPDRIVRNLNVWPITVAGSLYTLAFLVAYFSYLFNEVLCFPAIITLALSLCYFTLSFHIEHRLFKDPCFLKLNAEHRLHFMEQQIRVISGNPDMELAPEDQAQIRASVRPKREVIKSFPRILLVLLPLPVALTEWISKNIGSIDIGIPLTVFVVALIAPLVASALGSYLVIYSVDDDLLIEEMVEKYSRSAAGSGN